ncbi:hypothetical protein GGF31_008720 [Allomyces arbusculus]|nr:hypothetical protein GGF31_008720 [Allomyces arbusculus]
MPSLHTSASAPAQTPRRRATSSKNRAWDRERKPEQCFGQMSAQMGPEPVPLDKVLTHSGLVVSADAVTQPETRTETEKGV